MTTPRHDTLEALVHEVAALRAKTEALEAEVSALRTRAVRGRASVLKRVVVLAVALLATAGFGQAITSLIVFSADQPAIASEVNANFDLLKRWTETKVGAVGTSTVTMSGPVTVSNNVRIQAGPTSNATEASGKPLFVSGNVADGTSGQGGVEFRHDNLSQGVGIGYNTVYATGSNPNQPLNLVGRGSEPVVVLGNLRVNGNVWDGAYGESAQFGFTDGFTLGWSMCTNGYYMCGFGARHTANDSNYWTGAKMAIRCCPL